MELIKKIGASTANLAILEVTAQPPQELISTLMQLITTAVTVWYLIKKPRPKNDIDIQP